MVEASIQETIEKVLQGQHDMAMDFTMKLGEAMTTVTEKINHVTSYHITLDQTVTELRFAVMR